MSNDLLNISDIYQSTMGGSNFVMLPNEPVRFLDGSNFNRLLDFANQSHGNLSFRFVNQENLISSNPISDLFSQIIPETLSSSCNISNNKNFIQTNFDRKKLNENKNLFYPSNLPPSNINLENYQVYTQLNSQIQQGKDILFQELDKWRKFKMDLQKNEKNKSEILSITKEISQKLEVLQNQSCLYDLHDDYKTHVPLISKNLSSVSEQIVSEIDQKLNTLKNDIKDSQIILSLMSESYQILNCCTLKNQCPICLQNEVTHFNHPCGHTFCERCKNTLQMQCHMCRSEILNIKTLFYN